MPREITSQVQNSRLVEERRELIIGAAVKVFRRNGFHAATTHDIATAAGVTQSNLYNYIGSKDDILYMVCDRLFGRYGKAVEEVCARHEDPHTRLVEAARSVIQVMCLHKEELVLLYNNAHLLQKDDRRLIQSMISNFIERFQDLVVAYEKQLGPTRLANKRLSANLLSFVPAVAALRSWDLVAHVGSEELQEGLLEFVLAGVGVPNLRPKAAEAEHTRAPAARRP
jgi:AcrR family transcriptional regulator